VSRMAIKMEEIFQFHQGLSERNPTIFALRLDNFTFNSIKDYQSTSRENQMYMSSTFNSIKDYREKEVNRYCSCLYFQFHQGLSEPGGPFEDYF